MANGAVYPYGKTDVLLHYHARLLDVATAAELKQLARAEQLELDIVPKASEAGMQLTLLWRGKPVAGRTVIIRGPKGFKANPKTDKKGTVSFKPEAAGTYLFRASVDEKASGTLAARNTSSSATTRRCRLTFRWRNRIFVFIIHHESKPHGKALLGLVGLAKNALPWVIVYFTIRMTSNKSTQRYT